MIVEDASIIDKLFASFQRRIVAITINTNVAIPDIATRAIGTLGFPSKSSADDKTDNIYVPMPKNAIVLFFIKSPKLKLKIIS